MLRRLAFVSPLLVLACAARPTEAEDDTDASTTSGGPDPTTMTTAPPPGTTSDTGQVDTTGADTAADTMGFINMPTDGGPSSLPDGSECGADEDCASMFCFEAFGSGVCSQCSADDDCESGGCSLDFNVGYAVCNDGSLGDGCESDDACNGGLVCGSPLSGDLPFDFEVCGECNAATACDGGTICSPSLGMGLGYLACVEPGSVDIGGGCPIAEPGVGDGTVCISGACSAAELFMGAELGICSECATDDDCTGGGTGTGGGSDTGGGSGTTGGSDTGGSSDTGGGAVCIPAEIGMDGIFPAVCG